MQRCTVAFVVSGAALPVAWTPGVNPLATRLQESRDKPARYNQIAGSTRSLQPNPGVNPRATTKSRDKPARYNITEIAGSTRSLQYYRNRGVNPLATNKSRSARVYPGSPSHRQRRSEYDEGDCASLQAAFNGYSKGGLIGNAEPSPPQHAGAPSSAWARAEVRWR